MEKNKGGRPAHHAGEIKKSPIAVRTAPSVRDALKAAADKAGRSITQEVEARLIASFAKDGGQRSPETERLLDRIAAEITSIEEQARKRWHKSRFVAGALMEMFERKAAFWLNVDDPYDDEDVLAAWNKLDTVRTEKRNVIETLNKLGITASPIDPVSALLGKIDVASPEIDEMKGKRWRERAQLEKIDLPDYVKRATVHVLDHLERLDADERVADLAYTEQIAPYSYAELDGRAFYRQTRRRIAEDVQRRGGNADLADWIM